MLKTVFRGLFPHVQCPPVRMAERQSVEISYCNANCVTVTDGEFLLSDTLFIWYSELEVECSSKGQIHHINCYCM